MFSGADQQPLGLGSADVVGSLVKLAVGDGVGSGLHVAEVVNVVEPDSAEVGRSIVRIVTQDSVDRDSSGLSR